MSFIVAGCALMLALLVGILIDDMGATRQPKAWQDRSLPDGP